MKTYFVAYGGFECPDPNKSLQWDYWIERVFPMVADTDIIVICCDDVALKYFSDKGATVVRLLESSGTENKGFDLDYLIEYDKWQSYNWGPHKKTIETVKTEALKWINRWATFFSKMTKDCQFVFHGPHPSFRKVPEIMARERGIKRLYLNRWFDRPYLDKVGYTQRSSVTYVWNNLKMRALSEEQYTKLNRNIISIHLEKYSRLPFGKTSLKRAISLEDIGIPTGCKMLLQLDQYPFDGNKVMHNPLMVTKDEYIRPMVDVIKSRPSWHLVVKKHPEDDWSKDNEFTDCFDGADRCHFVNNINIHDMLSLSSAVIVLNSTSGLEALTYKKPVITTADAIYANKGFTWDVKSHADYKKIVSGLLGKISLGEDVLGNKQKEDIDKFLYYLMFETGNGIWE